MAYNEEVTMMMSVVPGSMTGISAMMGGLASITNVFTDITRQIDANFGLIDASIITLSTIVGQLGLEAAESFGKFEQGLKVAQMVSGQTTQEMDFLRQKANEFSVSFRVDIDQITEGLQTLGRAGLNSASEQTEVLESGLSTAKLEGRDLNGVLEELIQNTALLGGNLKSSDFGENSKYLNDIMVATSMTAPITTHDVSETLKYSGGIAAAAGANVNTDEGKAILEDYMGAIAAFAQKGVTGSIAGTALRAFFNKPATQDSSVTEALASIKLKPEYLWEEDEDTMKPVSEQIGIIQRQMDKLDVSTMDRLQIWSKIVGGKMGQQMMKLDSDSIKSLTKDIQSANDAESLAAGTFDTYQMKMKEMTEQGQVAFRQFGEYVATVLTPVLEIITHIFEVLSNPVASFSLFVGGLSLISLAVNKLRNVFSLLKTELKTVGDYFLKGDKLLAKRPSTERKENRNKKNKRYSPENLEKKYPGQSIVSAHSKERQLEAEEKLLKKGYSLEEVDIIRQSGKLRGDNVLLNNSRNAYTKESLYPVSMRRGMNINLDSLSDRDAMRYLIDNGLLTSEMTNTFYEQGRNLPATIDIHRPEIISSLYNFNRKKIIPSSSQIKSPENVLPYNGKTIPPYVPGGIKLDESYFDYEKELSEEDRTYRQGLRDDIREMDLANLKRLNPFPEEALERDIGAHKNNLQKAGKTYVGNNLVFDNVEEVVLNRYLDEYVDSFESKVTGLSHFEEKYGEFNDLTSSSYDDYDALMDTLGSAGFLPDNKKIRSRLEAKLRERGRESKAEAFDKYYKQYEENILKEGRSMQDVAMLSRSAFSLRFNEILPAMYDMEEFHQFVLQKSGITDGLIALNRRRQLKQDVPETSKYNGVEVPSLLSDDEIERYLGRTTDKNKLRNHPEYGKEYDPIGHVNREEKKKDSDKKKDMSYEENLRLQALEAQKRLYSDFEYWTEEELLLPWSSPKMKENPGRYLRNDDIKKAIYKMYGHTLDVKSKSLRPEIIKKALPYLMDWNLDSTQGGMDSDQFRHFAYTLGAEIPTHIKKRSQMVDYVNTELANKTVEKQILAQKEEEARKAEELLRVQEERLRLEKEVLISLQNYVRTTPEYFYNELKHSRKDYKKGRQKHYDAINEQIARETEAARLKENLAQNEEDFKNLHAYTRTTSEFKESEERQKKEREKEKKFERLMGKNLSEAEKEEYKRRIQESREKNNYQGLVYQDEIKNDKGEVIRKGKWVQKDLIDPEKIKISSDISKGLGAGYYNYLANINSIPDNIGLPLTARIKQSLPSINIPKNLGERIQSSLFDSQSSGLLRTAGKYNELSKIQKVGNIFSKGIDLMGGPLMAGIEGVTIAIEMWKQWYQEYTESLKEAANEVKEAYVERDSAESALLQSYRDSNPDATDEELEDAMLNTYSTMFDEITTNQKKFAEIASQRASTLQELEYDEEKDDGSYKPKEEEKDQDTLNKEALDKNTSALYNATSKLGMALDNLQKKMNDSWWGIDGWTGAVTDWFGELSDKAWDNIGTTFTSNGNKFLLTASQKDDNYPGYTEMAGLMLEDFKDAGGDWKKGLKTMMGKDAEFTTQIMSERTKERMDEFGKFTTATKGGLSAEQNSRLQASMKNDPKTWDKLAKSIAKQEMKKNASVVKEKNSTKKIEGLVDKIRLTLGTGFDRTRVLQAAYLQVAQGMFSVAQTVFVPIMQQNAAQAANAVRGIFGVQDTTGGTEHYTNETAAIAGAIASMLGTIALAQSADVGQTTAALYEDINGDGSTTEEEKHIHELATSSNSGTEFLNAVMKDEDTYKEYKSAQKGIFGWTGIYGDEESIKKYRAGGDFLAQIYGGTTYQTVRGYDSKKADDTVQKVIEEGIKNGASPSDIIRTIGKNWDTKDFRDKIVEQYLNSGGEEGTGSGSGSGSGSGDKDKDQGTKKERVDLVLCSKKEIPKLNVNLFKKPPTFTVLNKNFKVRDVKINTEDTPKAIMSAIKNSFIDVQKRSDPKIIQDEEGVYNPEEATEGNPLPSGTAKTRTD